MIASIKVKTKYKYKTLSMLNVLSAIRTLFPSAVANGDYIEFADTIPGHQAGDEYAIRIEQEESSTGYPNTYVGDIISYKPYYAPWTETGEFAEPGFDSDRFTDTNMVGRKIKFQIEEDATILTWSEGASVTGGNVYFSSGSYYVAQSSGTTGKKQPIHHKGIASDGAIDWLYWHSGFGTATVTSVEDAQHLTAVVDGALPVLRIGQNSYSWRNYQWSMWGYQQRYPDHVFFFKGRLCYFCSTVGYGCWFQASNTDDYMNFSTEDFGQVLDTCGINILVSGYPDNSINWLLSGDRLYCGSYSGEYNIFSGDSSSAISPTSCLVDPITTIGGAKVRALRFRGLNLFVGRTRDEIYSISYDYTTDDYVPENIGFMSSHLLSPGVRRWVALDNADRNIYFNDLSDDLCVINYVKEVKYLGYYRINLSGQVLDLASTNSGEESALYLLVCRDHDTLGKVYTIERAESDAPQYMLCRKRTDFSLVGARPDIPEFVGKKVWVKNPITGEFYETTIEDAHVIPGLSSAWPYVDVGLPMECVLHGQAMSGEKLEGLQQKSVRFIVRLRDSGAFSYGSSIDFSKKYEYNNWNLPNQESWDSAHKLITGDIQLPASFGYTVGMNKGTGEYPNDTGVGLNIYSESPEPFCLLSVSCLYV